MLRRTLKQFLFKSMKRIFYFAVLYGVLILLTAKSQEKLNEEMFSQKDSARKRSIHIIDGHGNKLSKDSKSGSKLFKDSKTGSKISNSKVEGKVLKDTKVNNEILKDPKVVNQISKDSKVAVEISKNVKVGDDIRKETKGGGQSSNDVNVGDEELKYSKTGDEKWKESKAGSKISKDSNLADEMAVDILVEGEMARESEIGSQLPKEQKVQQQISKTTKPAEEIAIVPIVRDKISTEIKVEGKIYKDEKHPDRIVQVSTVEHKILRDSKVEVKTFTEATPKEEIAVNSIGEDKRPLYLKLGNKVYNAEGKIIKDSKDKTVSIPTRESDSDVGGKMDKGPKVGNGISAGVQAKASNVRDHISTDLKFNQVPPVEAHDRTPPQKNKTVEAPTKSCPGLTFPNLFNPEATWQSVDRSKVIYFISAYYIKERNSVFVIGARPQTELPVFCQFWGFDGTEEQLPVLLQQQQATEPEFFTYRGFQYTTTVYECPVKSPVQPKYVSMVKKKCAWPGNLLKINSASKSIPYQRRLTVCLRPLIEKFDDAKEFVNWIEINKMLGVERFVIYLHSCSRNIESLLHHYGGNGIVEVVQWDPPLVLNGSAPETRPVQLQDYGETTALNDCLFRNKKYSEFILNLDIKEFMIPLGNNKQLLDMIRDLNMDVAAYYISMAFKVDSTKNLENKTISNTETKGKRISKMIIRTSEVDFALRHQAPGAEGVIVPTSISVLHRRSSLDLNQILGTSIDNLLPVKQMDKVRNEVKNIREMYPNIKL